MLPNCLLLISISLCCAALACAVMISVSSPKWFGYVYLAIASFHMSSLDMSALISIIRSLTMVNGNCCEVGGSGWTPVI